MKTKPNRPDRTDQNAAVNPKTRGTQDEGCGCGIPGHTKNEPESGSRPQAGRSDRSGPPSRADSDIDARPEGRDQREVSGAGANPSPEPGPEVLDAP